MKRFILRKSNWIKSCWTWFDTRTKTEHFFSTNRKLLEKIPHKELLKRIKEVENQLMAKPLEGAKEAVRDILDEMTMQERTYQGKIDICEWVDFQELATMFGLCEEEYEELIDFAQAFAEKKLEIEQVID